MKQLRLVSRGKRNWVSQNTKTLMLKVRQSRMQKDRLQRTLLRRQRNPEDQAEGNMEQRKLSKQRKLLNP